VGTTNRSATRKQGGETTIVKRSAPEQSRNMSARDDISNDGDRAAVEAVPLALITSITSLLAIEAAAEMLSGAEAHAAAEARAVGSLFFTYGAGGYSTALAAKLSLFRSGMVCQHERLCTSKYNEQYVCHVLSVDFEPGSGGKSLAVVFEVKGDGSLGDVQLPSTSDLAA